MKPFALGLAALATLVVAPARADVVQQVLDDFATPGPAGRPAGWDAVGIGAEATLTHVAGNPSGLKLEYRFTAPDGVVYLLRRARLRTPPRSFELTANGHGGRLRLGLMLRDGTDDELFEYRSPLLLEDDNWATLEVPTVAHAALDGEVNGKLDALDGGGGVRLEGLTVRRAEGGPDAGSLEVGAVTVACDVETSQQAMIDALTARFDGVFHDGEAAAPELLVSSMAPGPAAVSLQYDVTDAAGRNCGSGTPQVNVRGERLTRVPVEFRPPSPRGHFTLRARATVGGSTRSVTLRWCVGPTPADGEPKVAVTVRAQPGATQPWVDPLVVRTLKRAGAGLIRLEVPWRAALAGGVPSPLREWLPIAHAEGARLLVSLIAEPAWLREVGRPPDAARLAAAAATIRDAAGDTLAALEIWPGADTARLWPPAPQPFGYRAVLADCQAKLGDTRPVLIGGGLRGFDAGFVGTLLTSAPYPLDALSLAPASPRVAPPDGALPSAEAATQLAAYRAWLKSAGHAPAAVWLGPVAVPTSPLEETKGEQAAELARLAILAGGHGGGLIWSAARDGADETDRFGLLRRDFQPKESLAALAVAASLLAGRQPLGAAAGEGSSFVLTGAAGFLAGTYGAGRLTLTGETTVLDVWGNRAEAGGLRGAPAWVTGPGVATSFPVAR